MKSIVSLLAETLHLPLQEMATAMATLDPAMATAMEMVREPSQYSVCILFAADGFVGPPQR